MACRKKISDLKVGDEVIIYSSTINCPKLIGEVVEIKRFFIMIENHFIDRGGSPTTFLKSNGHIKNNNYISPRVFDRIATGSTKDKNSVRKDKKIFDIIDELFNLLPKTGWALKAIGDLDTLRDRFSSFDSEYNKIREELVKLKFIK